MLQTAKEDISLNNRTFPKPAFSFPTESERFDYASRFSLDSEGGLSKNQKDAANKGGKITMRGVTRDTYEEYEKKYGEQLKNEGRPLSPQKKLTEPEATDIYKKLFWEKGMCHVMPATVSVVYFDACINHGTHGAGKMLQKALVAMGSDIGKSGANHDGVDGKVGDKTIDAVWKLNPENREKLCAEIIKLRRELYSKQSKEEIEEFGKGWENRIKELERYLETNRASLISPVNPIIQISDGSKEIQLGDKGYEVYYIQRMLQLKGFEVKADGKMGASTEEAIKSVQSTLRNHEPHGRVDRETLQALK